MYRLKRGLVFFVMWRPLDRGVFGGRDEVRGVFGGMGMDLMRFFFYVQGVFLMLTEVVKERERMENENC